MHSNPTESPEEGRDLLSRRGVLQKVAAPSLALLLSGRPARAQVAPRDVLNFALEIAYLERAFYRQGLEAGLIPGEAARVLFRELRDHEAAHVDWLRRAIEQQAGVPAEAPSFDFTAGGQFEPFADYTQFLTLAQGFEDTAVRAYRGQVPALLGSELLTGLLRIHSVEARHASAVRRLLAREGIAPGQAGWIEGAGTGAPDVLTDLGVYEGEDDTTVAGNDLSGLGGYGDPLVTAAYDQPLTRQEVQERLHPFVAGADGDER